MYSRLSNPLRAASALGVAAAVLLLSASVATAQLIPAPDRGANEGEGPFDRLILKGVTVIDGTGGPPRGPMDVVIEGNRIASIRGANPDREPDPDAHEIDAWGHYVMPGFIDLHVHAGGPPKNAEAEYAYKLWMAHGITAVRGVSLTGHERALGEKARSERNEIVAPRIINFQRPGSGWDGGSVNSPEQARAYVRWAKENGVDGFKLGAMEPSIMEALLDEANQLQMGSTAHLAQTGVAEMNARVAASLGLTGMTHFYGLFESMLRDYSVQPWPVDHNHNDEQHRFGQVARLWDQIHEPGGEVWNGLIQEFLENEFFINPTMTIYAAGRDVERARNADWHEYTLPSMWDFFQPSRSAHGSYWFYWTTHDEVAWRNYYHVWMRFLNDYKKAGGRITTGSDSGFIYKIYGFGLIEELELLQEAGFHPLEVIRAATYHAAQEVFEPQGLPIEYGVVRPGMLADLVVVEENPLENLKVLYGTGAVRLNDDTGEVERVGGVKYTIKDGIVYDARQLLADVAAMVEQQRVERGVADSDR